MTINEKICEILGKSFDFLYWELPRKISKWYESNLAKFPIDLEGEVTQTRDGKSITRELKPTRPYINFAEAYNSGKLRDRDIIIIGDERYRIKQRVGLQRRFPGFNPGIEVENCKDGQLDCFYWDTFPEWEPAYTNPLVIE